MTTKVVVRLLTADQILLGWAEVQALARGDGQLWCQAPVLVGIEAAGALTWLSVHWADVNVETRTACDGRAVHPGQIVTVFPHASPILCVGPMPGYLPPVTVHGPVALAVPLGQMGAIG